MDVELLLARQAGVISRDQALRAGLGGPAVDRLLRTRRWRPLHPRVYLVPGAGPPDEARARAALLWAGAGAALSGAAAAWWHGLPVGPPDPLVLSVTTAVPVRRDARPGVVLRRRALPAADRTVHRGLPVTALGLTVLDAAVELGETAGGLLLDRAVAERAGLAEEVLAAHRRHPDPAVGPLLAAVAARAAAAAAAVLVELLRGSGLRGWHRLPGGPGRQATVVFPAARVAVEVAGWPEGAAPLPDPRTAVLGDPRGMRIGPPGRPGPTPLPGWRVLRFDPAELTGRPRATLNTIAAAVHNVISTTSEAG